MADHCDNDVIVISDDVIMISSDDDDDGNSPELPPASKRKKISSLSRVQPSALEYSTVIAQDELPSCDQDEQRRLYRESKPYHPPKTNTKEYELLSAFCKEVDIFLQVVSDDEYQAATTLMKPPSEEFEKAVVFPSAGTVVGLFAGHKTALIQTDAGSYSSDYVQSAINTFSNARFIIAVGACYAFDRSKFKPGDVLVSKKISDLKNLKFNENFEVIDRGETIDVVNTLKSVFCMNMTFEEDFVCSKSDRVSSIYSGRYASHTAVLNNKEMCDKFLAAVPEAIGGDMEGGELLRFQQNRKIEGIIVIKGVAGYADGCGGKEWQFTAALAALKYAQSKLYYFQCQDNSSGIAMEIDHSILKMPEPLSRYRDYLMSYYKGISGYQIEDRFFIAPCDEFINLALIEKPEDSFQEVSNETCNVDEIVASKIPIELDALVSPDAQFVLVEGPPGIGKSTLCWELCRKWDTLKSLQHFKIVLLLRLRERHVQNATKLNEIFLHGDEELCQSVVKEVYRCEGEGVLLILDGFDEVPKSVVKSSLLMDIITRRYIPKTTLLVTSRPSAVHHKKRFPMNRRHVEILGFTDESKVKFAEFAFRSRPKVMIHFKEFIFSNPIINSLMYIPINCAIVAQVYREISWSKKLMPKTMTELYKVLVLVLIRKHMIDKQAWDEDSELPNALEELQKDIFSILKEVSKLAYGGLFNDDDDVQLEFSDSDVGKKFEHLGLLTVSKEMYVTKNAKTSYSFPHMSMQEFLAAWHVSGEPQLVNEKSKLFQNLCDIPKVSDEDFMRNLSDMPKMIGQKLSESIAAEVPNAIDENFLTELPNADNDTIAKNMAALPQIISQNFAEVPQESFNKIFESIAEITKKLSEKLKIFDHSHPDVLPEVMLDPEHHDGIKAHHNAFVRFLAGMVGLAKLLPRPVTKAKGLLFHCLFEAQTPSDFKLLAIEEQDVMYRSNPLDAYVFGYALIHAPIKWRLSISPASFEMLLSSLAHHAEPDAAVSGCITELAFKEELGGPAFDFPKLSKLPTSVLNSIDSLSFSITSSCLSIDGLVAGIAAMYALSTLDVKIESCSCPDDFKLFESFQNLYSLQKVSLCFEKCMLSNEGIEQLSLFFSKSRVLEDVKIDFYNMPTKKELVLGSNFNPIISSALSCPTVASFTTNIPFILFRFPSNLKRLKFECSPKSRHSTGSEYTTTTLSNFICLIADMCKMSSVESLTLNCYLMKISIPPQLYCNFVSLLNESLCYNSTIRDLCLSYCEFRPLNNIGYLSQALRKGTNHLRADIKRSKSLCDLATPKLSKDPMLAEGNVSEATVSRSFSCPDLLELESVSTLHPLLAHQLGAENDHLFSSSLAQHLRDRKNRGAPQGHLLL